ncbi:hypothetical protein F0U62_09800 [Cystobacter fuscus]|uniref:hypothetical protein n=1 Tax=Cystobacter fuscus TaxID=43 RepID=UPI002B296D2E|nr:hypothetical protein F0U62_09800 [Cystobacter fuscus]
MIHDLGEVYYSQKTQDEHIELKAIRVDASGTILSERTVIRTGQKVDGQTVVRLGKYDLNRKGELLVVIHHELSVKVPTIDDRGRVTGEQFAQTQMLCLDTGSGIRGLVKEGDTALDGHRMLGSFSNVVIHDDSQVVFTADYLHFLGEQGGQPQYDPRQGLFTQQPGSHPVLVVHNDALIIQELGSSSIARFGLVDLHDHGNLVVQVHTLQAPKPTAQSLPHEAPKSQTVLLQGNLKKLQATLPLGGLQSPPHAAGVRKQGIGGSAVRFGPRAGGLNATGYVLSTGKQQQLLVRDQVLYQTGDTSPEGNTVTGSLPPVMGSAGEVYFVLSTQTGYELCAYNGQERRTLLRSGAILTPGGSPIDRIWLGSVTQQLDRVGRLAFVVTHQDNRASVVLGLPV